MKNRWNNLPFPPARLPFFYGWGILFAGTLGILMSIPGQTVGVSVFTDYLLKALHLSRTQLSVSYLVGTITSSLILTWGGLLYDRFGARLIGAVVSLSLGVVLVALSKVESIVNLIVRVIGDNWAIPTALVVITVGFLGLRFLGQGVLTLISRNMIMKWFDRKRGLANGISGIFVSFSFGSAPLLLNVLIDNFTWHGAWLVLGLIIGFGFTVFALLFYRDNPEGCGLIADGSRHKDAENADSFAAPAVTLAEARRTLKFWLYNGGLAMMSLFITAFTFHVISIFRSGGMDSTQAVAIFFPASLIAVGVNLFFGWLSDSIKLKYLLLGLLGGLILSSIGLLFIAPGVPVLLIIIGNGLATGLFSLLIAVTWPRFYGRTHMGAISGFNMSFLVFSSAVGPTLFSISREKLGSYGAASLLCLGVLLLLFIGSLFDKEALPVRRLGQDQE